MKNKNTLINLTELISQLKNQEIRQKKIQKTVIGIYWAVITLYTAILILSKHSFFSIDKIGALLCLMGFGVILVFLKKSYKNMKKIDYSAHTIQMLHEVAVHYHSFVSFKTHKIKLLPILIGLLLIQIGITMKVYTIFENIEPLLRILYIQLVWFIILACGVGVGVLNWYNRYKPLRDNALALIKELEQ